MPATLEPTRTFPCTYEGCTASFDSERQLIGHKKATDEHDYCTKCNLDFEDFDAYAYHKAFAPFKHNKACRVCGEEFKSISGLRRHIELTHRIPQNLACIGCGEIFNTAANYIQHLEFGHCDVVSSEQFMGHVVHKHLIADILAGGPTQVRFMQKISQYDAVLDHEVSGGIELDNVLEGAEGLETANEVSFEAIQPEYSEEEVYHPGDFPPLTSQGRSTSGISALASGVGQMSMGGTESNTLADSAGNTVNVSNKEVKAWGGRTAKKLFPKAKPIPAEIPAIYSAQGHEQQVQEELGINIFNTRFWDPLCADWHPERFYNGVIQKYFCPFPCEQSFEQPNEMRQHILVSHRVDRVKCPRCLKYYNSVSALMGHCQSRGSKCEINKADEFNEVLNRVTGGFLSVEEKIRPDHLHNPTVSIRDPNNGRMVPYTPPVATYLKYTSCKPSDWKEPTRVAAVIGGGGVSGTLNYQGRQSTW